MSERSSGVQGRDEETLFLQVAREVIAGLDALRRKFVENLDRWWLNRCLKLDKEAKRYVWLKRSIELATTIPIRWVSMLGLVPAGTSLMPHPILDEIDYGPLCLSEWWEFQDMARGCERLITWIVIRYAKINCSDPRRVLHESLSRWLSELRVVGLKIEGFEEPPGFKGFKVSFDEALEHEVACDLVKEVTRSRYALAGICRALSEVIDTWLLTSPGVKDYVERKRYIKRRKEKYKELLEELIPPEVEEEILSEVWYGIRDTPLTAFRRGLWEPWGNVNRENKLLAIIAKLAFTIWLRCYIEKVKEKRGRT